MRKALRVTMYAGVGLADKVKEEVQDLVKRGEIKKKEGKELLDIAQEREKIEQSRLREFQDKAEAVVKNAIERIPQPATKKDIEALLERIGQLEARIQELEAAERRHVGSGSPN
jgi:polyhydroxyalkanoate synthesis regulator phasin